MYAIITRLWQLHGRLRNFPRDVSNVCAGKSVIKVKSWARFTLVVVKVGGQVLALLLVAPVLEQTEKEQAEIHRLEAAGPEVK